MEQNATNNPNKATKTAKAKPGLGVVMADHKAEFKKIVWPKKDEVAKKTVTVIVTSLLIGLIIFCMDTIYTGGFSAVMGLLGLV